MRPSSTTTTRAMVLESLVLATARVFFVAAGEKGCDSGLAGMVACGGAANGALGAAGGALRFRLGKIGPAAFQSAQPSRHTSESALTRPSAIHLRMISPLAGPNWPPEGGRTYQTELGASAIGSGGALGAAGTAAGTGDRMAPALWAGTWAVVAACVFGVNVAKAGLAAPG